MTARDWLWVNIMLLSWMVFGVPETVAEWLVDFAFAVGMIE